MPYTIGVDLGGTNIVAALADETGRLLARAHRPTAMPRSAEEIAALGEPAHRRGGLCQQSEF